MNSFDSQIMVQFPSLFCFHKRTRKSHTILRRTTTQGSNCTKLSSVHLTIRPYSIWTSQQHGGSQEQMCVDNNNIDIIWISSISMPTSTVSQLGRRCYGNQITEPNNIRFSNRNLNKDEKGRRNISRYEGQNIAI